jgi:hypothetical protein
MEPTIGLEPMACRLRIVAWLLGGTELTPLKPTTLKQLARTEGISARVDCVGG